MTSHPVLPAITTVALSAATIARPTPLGQANGTWTGHGVLSITAPGYGSVILEAGRTVVGPSGDVVFQAGPSDLSDYFGGNDEVIDDLCAALGA